MDIINHALIGIIIASILKQPFLQGIIYSILPDISVIIGAIIIGYTYKRKYFIALDSDRDTGYKLFPFLEKLYYTTHSILIIITIYLLTTYLLQIPINNSVLYYLIGHIIFDIITHTGNWSIKPLYPLSRYEIGGLTNIWSWSFKKGFLFNLIFGLLTIIIIFVNK